MRKPRILVTTSSKQAHPKEYIDALAEHEVETVVVPPSDQSRALDGFDGLLLTGGGDVDPRAYGAESSALAKNVDPDRDALEFRLVSEARERQMPTLCICRGLQVANVAFHGTLVLDIQQCRGKSVVPHELKGNRGLIEQHVVSIDEPSALARIVGKTELVTGGRHHQAVDVCAASLRSVARTPDDVVEALEARFESPFWLAVQWHPESTLELDDGASRGIFRAFADAARAHGE